MNIMNESENKKKKLKKKKYILNDPYVSFYEFLKKLNKIFQNNYARLYILNNEEKKRKKRRYIKIEDFKRIYTYLLNKNYFIIKEEKKRLAEELFQKKLKKIRKLTYINGDVFKKLMIYENDNDWKPYYINHYIKQLKFKGYFNFVKNSRIKKELKLSYYMAWVHIKCTYNNIIITARHNNNKILGWNSAGSVGFKGSQKSSFFAIKKTVKSLAERLKKKCKINNIGIIIKGKNKNLYHIIKSFKEKKIKVFIIKKSKNVAFNGCRLKKKRRV